jgi:hypothetical protein
MKMEILGIYVDGRILNHSINWSVIFRQV